MFNYYNGHSRAKRKKGLFSFKTFTGDKTWIYTGCLKKNDPRYNFAIDDPNEKNYTGNEMALKTLQTCVSI
jgi:hypothetical protein